MKMKVVLYGFVVTAFLTLLEQTIAKKLVCEAGFLVS